MTNILVKGSDTEVNVALTLAETFMAKDAKISIAVTGGGSGAGIAALLNDKTDIANSSRPMKAEEYEMAHERGIDPQVVIFAMDALAIVVNEKLDLDSITIAQVGAIYRGQITNWKALGAQDMPISLYGRQSNSGTFVYFQDSILQAEYSQDLKQMNGTAQIVEGLKTDPAGIGYVGVGYLVQEGKLSINGVKVLTVKENANSQSYAPTNIENIKTGLYPIVRPLFQYTNGSPKGKVRDFLLFCLSPEGQKLVEESGYYPVIPAYWSQNEKVLNFKYAAASFH